MQQRNDSSQLNKHRTCRLALGLERTDWQGVPMSTTGAMQSVAAG